MMDAAYLRHALVTALRVARFEKDAIADFDQSIEGFFRSFSGIVLCAPIYILILAAERHIAADAASEIPSLARTGLAPTSLDFFAIEAGAYLASWIAFPLAMIAIVRLIGSSARYVPYIVAYNWTACIVLAASMFPYLFYLAGLVSFTGILVFYYPVVIFALVYRWRIARDGLQIPALTATAVVIFDFLLSLLVAATAANLRGTLST